MMPMMTSSSISENAARFRFLTTGSSMSENPRGIFRSREAVIQCIFSAGGQIGRGSGRFCRRGGTETVWNRLDDNFLAVPC